jgi:hypothetical protein
MENSLVRVANRSEGQTVIPLTLRLDFLEAINEAAESLGYGSRAEFIRSAIVEKMVNDKIAVPAAALQRLAAAPTRVGKGGRPSHRGVTVNEIGGAKPLKKGTAEALSQLRGAVRSKQKS